MYCSKCGKGITDDSKFCYSCGSKVEIKKKQETSNDITHEKKQEIISDTHHSVVDQEISSEGNDIKKETHVLQTDKTESTSFLRPYQKIGWGYGWLFLLIIYGYGLSIPLKKYSYNEITIPIIITFIGLVPLFIFYFWFRKLLITKINFTSNNYASFISGLVSYILIGSLVGLLIGFSILNQKNSEIKQYMGKFYSDIKVMRQEESEHSKNIVIVPNNKKEYDNWFISYEKYRIFINKKKSLLSNLVSYLRGFNSKYKKDKTVNDNLDQLQTSLDTMINLSYIMLDNLKNYYLTGDEKYRLLLNESTRQQEKLKFEIDEKVSLILKSI